MLQAENQDGKIILLQSFTKQEIMHVKKMYRFFCPACKEKVMVKAGDKNVPHFSHLPDSTCPVKRGGEGVYHRMGKYHLFERIRKCQLVSDLEVYIPEIQQCPDILITHAKKRIAVEYQCARISQKVINKRKNDYHKIGIPSFWILGEKLLKRTGKNNMQLDYFTRHFVHQLNHHTAPSLYYYSPQSNMLTIATDLHMISTTRAIAKFQRIPLSKATPANLFQSTYFTKKELLHLWKQAKLKFRTRPRHRLSAVELSWHQWLYEKKTHFEWLPSVIYLPVYSSYMMKTPLENWQSRLFLELIYPIKKGQEFSLKACYTLLYHHLLPITSLPNLSASHHPIRQYLEVLVKLEILEKTTPLIYRKKKDVQMYTHIEEALKGDALLLNHLRNL